MISNKSQNLNIALELNNTQRDFAGLFFTALRYCNKIPDSKLFIVPRGNLLALFAQQRINYLIISTPWHPIVPLASLLGTKVVVHDSEGIPYDFKHLIYNLNPLRSHFIHQYWLWGSCQYEHLTNNHSRLIPEHKLYVTGSLRYDLYLRLPPSSLQNQIQVNTNYPFLDPKFSTFRREVLETVLIYKIPSLLDDIPNSAARRERLISQSIKLTEQYAFDLRIRPHPFEASDYYKKSIPLYSNQTNFEIIDNTDIHIDLSSISVSLNCGCQSTLDSLIRGVVPISFEPAGNIWDKYTYSPSQLPALLSLKENLASFLREELINRGIGSYLANLSNDRSSSPELLRKCAMPILFDGLFSKLVFALFLIIFGKKKTVRITHKMLHALVDEARVNYQPIHELLPERTIMVMDKYISIN